MALNAQKNSITPSMWLRHVRPSLRDRRVCTARRLTVKGSHAFILSCLLVHFGYRRLIYI